MNDGPIFSRDVLGADMEGLKAQAAGRSPLSGWERAVLICDADLSGMIGEEERRWLHDPSNASLRLRLLVHLDGVASEANAADRAALSEIAPDTANGEQPSKGYLKAKAALRARIVARTQLVARMRAGRMEARNALASRGLAVTDLPEILERLGEVEMALHRGETADALGLVVGMSKWLEDQLEEQRR